MTIAQISPNNRNKTNYERGNLVIYAENSPEYSYVVLVTGVNPQFPERFAGVIVYAGGNRFAELGRHGVDFHRASFTRFHGEVSLQSE